MLQLLQCKTVGARLSVLAWQLREHVYHFKANATVLTILFCKAAGRLTVLSGSKWDKQSPCVQVSLKETNQNPHHWLLVSLKETNHNPHHWLLVQSFSSISWSWAMCNSEDERFHDKTQPSPSSRWSWHCQVCFSSCFICFPFNSLINLVHAVWHGILVCGPVWSLLWWSCKDVIGSEPEH